MKRPDRLASSQGLLLVEAVLSAVVIAVGLVFISRGLGGQLRSLEAVEEHDRLMPLAQSKLSELEGWGLRQKAIPREQLDGKFEEPNRGYQWHVKALSRTVPADSPALSDITLTVQSEKNEKNQVVLLVVWPSSWVEGSS